MSQDLTPLPTYQSIDMPLRVRVQSILSEWRKGCTCGGPGECLPCTTGAVLAIEEALLRETTPLLSVDERRKIIG